MKQPDLQRFLDAQESDYPTALSEIRRGHKSSHWMWYIFPQLKGLGQSPTSEYYGIHGLEEAREYLAHPLLGARLKEISEALLQLDTNDALQVMGSPDHQKLRSSMTLFSRAGDDPVFEKVLQKFFEGKPDPRSLKMLEDFPNPGTNPPVL